MSRWPDVSPIPAPLSDLAERHRRLIRAAERLELDLGDPENWDAIGAEAGITPPDKPDGH